MDGRPQPINVSLQRRLLYWIAGITIVSSLAAGAASFILAFREAQELQDEQLRQVSLLVERSGKASDLLLGPVGNFDHNDPDAQMIICQLGADAKNASLEKLPLNLPEGFLTLKSRGVDWRLFVNTLPTGERIAAAQMTSVRNEIARDSGLRTLLPILLLVPTLAFLASWIIRRSLTPVVQLAGQLDQRNDGNLSEISTKEIPSEIEPFVTAINHLMQRIDGTLAQQRRFIADAAHELRSPLTALTIHAENLEHTNLSTETKTRVLQLKSGLQRTTKLLEQLLNLARSQNVISQPENIRFDELVREVAEEYVPFSLSKQIDFGCQRFEPTVIKASPEDARMLVRNAIDNALRYTPQGGTVDVSIYQENGQTIFLVEDSGPGIPLDEIDRVFEPFYRVMGSGETGSGLGLSIVRSIAERLGGTIELSNRVEAQGARFCYRQLRSLL